MTDKQDVIEKLQGVLDPELMIDVWSLELIYDIKMNGDTIKILMTYTTPLCPYGPQLQEDITNHLMELDGVKNVEIEVTFTPRWKPSEELRAIFGV